jgi:hypothetical protein
MNAKVKVICSGSGVAVQLTKSVRDALEVEPGDEVMLQLGDVTRGPFEVGKVPLSTLRLLRLHQEEDVYAFVPRDVNVADGTEAILSVHELEAEPSEPESAEPESETESETDELPSEEERDDTVVPPSEDEIPEGEGESESDDAVSTQTRAKSKVEIIGEIVRDAMPATFTAIEVVNEAASRGLEITVSYASEILRKIDGITITRGQIGTPNVYTKS